MRPRTLDEFAGQRHILAPGQLLRRAIEADRVQSVIFYGPPGTGKTSLAQIIARQTRSKFDRLSGVESNVADMRRVLAAAANRLENTGQSTILFIDEIHRFNKAQQDVLLPDVESGVVRLIGATTHNPFFFVNSPLVSRSQIFELQPLTEEDSLELLRRALTDAERGLGHIQIKADEEALRHLAKVADGDARKALNSLEIAALTTPPGANGVIHIDLAVAEQCIQKKAVVYDADGDAHYDTISAFIKSMRGGDVDAALYWLAKMIHAGEDPRFISRRILICAAEDVGLGVAGQVPGADGDHHHAGDHERREDHVRPGGQQRGVGQQGHDGCQHHPMGTGVDPVADRVLHPRVGRHDERRGQHRTQAHRPDRQQVHRPIKVDSRKKASSASIASGAPNTFPTKAE